MAKIRKKKSQASKVNKDTVKNKTKASGKTAYNSKKQGKRVGDLSPKELDDFYKSLCGDLVFWLTNASTLTAGHYLTDRDAFVESEGLHRPSMLDLETRYLNQDKVTLGKPFIYITDTTKLPKEVAPYQYSVVLTRPIPVQILRKGDFLADDFSKYSYAHFHLLKFMLEVVDKRFHDFVAGVNIAMEHRNAIKNSNSDPIARAANNLNELLKLLKKDSGGYTGIWLPDLFAVDPRSAMPTHDLDYFKSQESEKNKFKRLYTYMYSRESSQAFSTVLVELLEKKMGNLESELSFSKSRHKNSMQELSFEKWWASHPKTTTKERMKMALWILGLRNEEGKNEKKVSWTVGDLIFIYRALEQCGAIVPGIRKSQVAVALEILTGKTHLKYLNHYVSAKQKNINFSKSFEIKSDAPSRESIHLLVKRLKKALDDLLKEIK